jgi:hypothetical protein
MLVKRVVITPRSRDASEAEAERRWTHALHESFASKPSTYAEIIEAITPDIQAAATKAELQCRAAGIAYIIRRLRLGDEPRRF